VERRTSSHNQRPAGRQAERQSDGAAHDHRRAPGDHAKRVCDVSIAGKTAESVLRILGATVGQETMQRYLGRPSCVSMDDQGLRIEVPSRFAADLIERRLGSALRDASGGSSIRFDIASNNSADTEKTSDQCNAGASKPGRHQAAGSAQRHPARTPMGRHKGRSIHAAQTLDSFVVGPSNRFAFAAASRLAEGHDPCQTGPFFLYGPCGIGKTHLVNAVLNRFRELSPGARTRIVTAETFTNEYIAAIRSNTIESFHRQYRKVDLLCIDDVHFLATKAGTQTELLHTFDQIGNGGGRIVLASDSHPGEIQKFSNALTSRFMSGSLVRIDLPDADTRRRMIVHFAARGGLKLCAGAVSVLESVASADASGRGLSVRDLAGIVNRVSAYMTVMGGPGSGSGEISVADVEAALRGQSGYDAATPANGRPVSMPMVIDRVCEGLEVTRDDLAGKGRHPRVVLARAMVTLLARRLTRGSYPEIARAIGRSNHSTVITAHRRINKQILEAKAVQVGLPLDGTPISVVAERFERAVRSLG